MFGEYLPFGERLPGALQVVPATPAVSRRERRSSRCRSNGHEIATFICYEDIIPAFVRSDRANRRTRTCSSTSPTTPWFGDTTEPWIHLALAKLRAVEHRRFLVRSTNSGVSAIIDPVGRVVGHTETFREQALAADAAWVRASTPYGLWGDGAWWLGAIVSVVMAFVPKARLFRRSPGPPRA